MRRIAFLILVLFALAARAAVTSTTTVSGPYTCDGTTTDFTAGFPFQANADLVVVKSSAGGVNTTLTLGTDYTVTGAGGSSGTVSLVSGANCPSTYTLTITRTLPLTQPTAFSTQGSFSPKVHERAFDRLEMQMQQVNRVAQAGIPGPTGPQGVPGSINAIGSNLNFTSTYTGINVPDPVGAQDVATKNYVDVGSSVKTVNLATSTATNTTPVYPNGLAWNVNQGKEVEFDCVLYVGTDAPTTCAPQVGLDITGATGTVYVLAAVYTPSNAGVLTPYTLTAFASYPGNASLQAAGTIARLMGTTYSSSGSHGSVQVKFRSSGTCNSYVYHGSVCRLATTTAF